MNKIKSIIITVIIFTITLSFTNTFGQNTEEQFAEDFIRALASQDIEELIKLKPSSDFWRIILEKETKDMTDEEINLKANKNEKLILDFDNIMYSAKKEYIDLNIIELKRVKIHKIWEDDNMPLDMIIKYIYNKKEGVFAISVYKYDGKYYLSEIRESLNIFSKLK